MASQKDHNPTSTTSSLFTEGKLPQPWPSRARRTRSSSHVPTAASKDGTITEPSIASWSHDHDQRLLAAVANISYERSRGVSLSVSGQPWAHITAVAFPRGEHTKGECSARSRQLKGPSLVKEVWSTVEDERLLRLVNEHGTESWGTIAQHLGSRTGKQCRERWHNHVNPSVLHTPFSAEEDAIIIGLYNTIGSKWAEMSRRLKGRSDNAIKNHFNTTLSRRYMLTATLRKSVELLETSQNNSDATIDGSNIESVYHNPGVAARGMHSNQGGFQAGHEESTSRFTSSSSAASPQSHVSMQPDTSTSYFHQSNPPLAFIEPSWPQAFPRSRRPLNYEHHTEYQEDASVYPVPQYANLFSYPEPRRDGLDMRRASSKTNASASSECFGNSEAILRQQAESLSSWQSFNGSRALPPLSLVATTAHELPQTPSHAHLQPLPTGSAPSAFTSSIRTRSESTGKNSALGLIELNEVLLTPPLCRLQSSSASIEHLATSSSKRSANELGDGLSAQRLRRRTGNFPGLSSPLRESGVHPLLSPFRQHNQQPSDSVVSAPPMFASGLTASYCTSSNENSVSGSSASSHLPSPFQRGSKGDGNDYFRNSHAHSSYGAGSYHLSHAASAAAYETQDQTRNTLGLFDTAENNHLSQH